MPYGAQYNLLGVPLQFGTNAPILAEIAEEVFGIWRSGPSSPGLSPVRLEMFLHSGKEPSPGTDAPPLIYRAREDYLFLSRGDSFGFGHRRGGFATAFLTPEAIADRACVKIGFMECLGLFLVCQVRRATLHAAAVVHNGRCVLLTGSDGAGKSTLAYACLRAGFGLLAEDIVFAEEEGNGLWGNPRQLNLMPDVVGFFPELERVERVEQVNGETKIWLDVRNAFPGAVTLHHELSGVCLIEQSGTEETRLTEVTSETVRQSLTRFKENPMLDRPAMDRVATRFAEGRRARLQVGTDLDRAVAALQDWIES